MSAVFISHKNTPFDDDWAKRIHAWIREQKGIDGFLDFDVQHGLQAGGRWEDDIYAALHRAQIVIALISPEWLKSDWCRSEARIAKFSGRKLIPFVIAECANPFPETQTIHISMGEEAAFEKLRRALRTTHKLPARPYPGLAAYQEEDAAVFFGRADETRNLVNKVGSLFEGRPETPRLLIVLGASGSGKSSLMRAGLIPELRADPKLNCIEPIIPRGDPLKELARALDIKIDGTDAIEVADAILEAIKPSNSDYKHALIFIDQAEELLRGDRSFFFKVLRALLDRSEGRVLVVATTRSDFLNEFQQSGLIGIGVALDYATFTLDPLPEDHLSDIIRKPAALFGVAYEDRLVERITKEHDGPDALPLLAFFLDEFWREDYIRDGTLQIAEYWNFGGLSKALQKAVDRAIEACARLDAAYADRPVLLEDLRELFLGHLVSVSANSGEAVRSHARNDLLPEKERHFLTAFAKQRLLIEKDGNWEVVHEALFRQWSALREWIEAAREDLISIDRIETASTHWREAGRGDSDLTHTGNRLSEAARLIRSRRYKGRFTDDDKNYVAACERRDRNQLEKERALRDQAERQRASAEEQRAEAEKERARARRGEGKAKRFTKIAATVAAIAVGLSIFAFVQWKKANAQTKLANDQRALAETQRTQHLANTHDGDHVYGRLITREVLGQPKSWMGIAADQIRRRVPVIYNLPQPSGSKANVGSLRDDVIVLRYGSDKLFVTGHADNSIWLWLLNDATERYEPRLLGSHKSNVRDLSFQRNGPLLASSDEDGAVKIWDTLDATSTAAKYKLTPENDLDGAALRVRISADGEVVAALYQQGPDNPTGVALWRLDDGKARTLDTSVLPLSFDTGVTALDLNSDGTRLLVGFRDGRVEELPTAGGGEPRDLLSNLENPIAEVRQITYGESDEHWAFIDREGTIVWHNGERTDKEQLPQSFQDTISLRLDEDYLFAASRVEIHLNYRDSGNNGFKKFTEFYDPDRALKDVDFDGRQLLTSTDGASGISVWKTKPGPDHRVLAIGDVGDSDIAAAKLAYMGDGRLLAAYACGSVRVWSKISVKDQETGHTPSSMKLLGQLLPEADCPNPSAPIVTALDVSADNEHFALGLRDGRMMFGRISTGASPASVLGVKAPGPSAQVDRTVCEVVSTAAKTGGAGKAVHSTNTIWSIAFNPAATELIAGFQDGSVRTLPLDTATWEVNPTWDPTPTWRHRDQHEEPVCAVDWSADGERTMSSSQQVKINTIGSTGSEQDRSILLSNQSPALTALLSANGKQVLTGAQDQFVRQWPNVGKDSDSHVLSRYEIPVHTMALGPNDEWLLSAGGDTLRIACTVDTNGQETSTCRFKGQEVEIWGANKDKTISSVSISPEGREFATVDVTGAINLYRTDYRVALWRQHQTCMRVVDRVRFLDDRPDQAKKKFESCERIVARCAKSSEECARALGDP